MIQDFMYGAGRYLSNGEELYDRDNLTEGIQYAKNLKKFYGLKKEPLHGYNLDRFIKWCENKLKTAK